MTMRAGALVASICLPTQGCAWTDLPSSGIALCVIASSTYTKRVVVMRAAASETTEVVIGDGCTVVITPKR